MLVPSSETFISWLFFPLYINKGVYFSERCVITFLLFPFLALLCILLKIYILIGSCLTLQMLQLAEYHANAMASTKPPKRPSIRERKQKLLAFLRGILLGIELAISWVCLFFFIHCPPKQAVRASTMLNAGYVIKL